VAVNAPSNGTGEGAFISYKPAFPSCGVSWPSLIGASNQARASKSESGTALHQEAKIISEYRKTAASMTSIQGEIGVAVCGASAKAVS